MSISLKKLQNNFSRAAVDYDTHAHFQHEVMQRVIAHAKKLFPREASVLDIGCGTGRFAQTAQESGWRITGIDIAAQMCRIASTRCKAAQANAEMLPFADARFDAVISSLCLQWVEDKQAAFSEIARILKPNATAVIATLGNQTLHELRAEAIRCEIPLGLLTMQTADKYQCLASTAGLTIEHCDDAIEQCYYPSARALLESMRQIGARNANKVANEAQHVSKWRHLLSEYDRRYQTTKGVYATWQPIVMTLRKAS